MNENPENNNNEILSLLIDKQINKIIETNKARDCYFSIRQNFDIDQFLWDIATHVYSSIGEKIDFVKTRAILKQCQESAYVLYANEQEKQRREQVEIQREKIRLRKETIYQEINLREAELSKISGQKILGELVTMPTLQKNVLYKILGLKKELLNLLMMQKEVILSDLEKAKADFNINLMGQLQYVTMIDVESEIENINQDLSKISNEIKLKEVEEDNVRQLKIQEQERARKEESNARLEKENYLLSIARQVGNESKTELLLKVLELIESGLAIDYRRINLYSDIFNDLGADEFDLHDLVTAIEDEIEIKIPDELLGITYFGKPISCSIKELLQFFSDYEP